MRRCSYPSFAPHKAAHDTFTRRVDELLEKQRQGGKSVVTIEVLQMLKQWLVTHIKGTDQLYVPYVADA